MQYCSRNYAFALSGRRGKDARVTQGVALGYVPVGLSARYWLMGAMETAMQGVALGYEHIGLSARYWLMGAMETAKRGVAVSYVLSALSARASLMHNVRAAALSAVTALG